MCINALLVFCYILFHKVRKLILRSNLMLQMKTMILSVCCQIGALCWLLARASVSVWVL